MDGSETSVASVPKIKVPYEDFPGTTTAEKLRFIRKHLNKTPTELAAIAGVTVRTYYCWEKPQNGSRPSTEAAEKLACYTGVPKIWLKPPLEYSKRYAPMVEARRKYLVEILWPDGDQPDDKAIDERIKTASKLIIRDVVRHTFLRYYFGKTSRIDLAVEISSSASLVSRHVNDAITILRNSNRARKILTGQQSDKLSLEDNLSDLIGLGSVYKNTLIKFGILTVGDLVNNFWKIVNKEKVKDKLIKRVLTALEKEGLQPKELEVAPGSNPKDHFSILYNILYPDQKVTREIAIARVEKALECLTVPRHIAIFKSYYIGGKTLEEIGQEFKRTRERVRQIIARTTEDLNTTPSCQKILKDDEYIQSAITLATPVYMLGIRGATANNLKKCGIHNVGQVVHAINHGSIKNIDGIGKTKINQLITLLKENGIEATLTIKPKRPRKIFCTEKSIAAVLKKTEEDIREKAKNENWPSANPQSEGELRKYELSKLPSYIKNAVGRLYSVWELAVDLKQAKQHIQSRAIKESWTYVEVTGIAGKANIIKYPLNTLPVKIRTKLLNKDNNLLRDEKKKALNADKFSMEELALIKIIRMKKINPDRITQKLLEKETFE